MATIEQKLEEARIAISNALGDVQMLSTLTPYGYGVERLQAGLMLYENARNRMRIQGDARQQKLANTKNFQQLKKQAKIHYHHDLRSARVALKSQSESRYFLQLNGMRSMTMVEWLKQARDFYQGLRDRPELQTAVGVMGLTDDRLQQGLQYVEMLEAGRLQQSSHKGKSGDLCRLRDEALAALEAWMIVFRHTARAALASMPAQLATLGLEPRKKKKKVEEVKSSASQPQETRSVTQALP